jgi:hypothetical protein
VDVGARTKNQEPRTREQENKRTNKPFVSLYLCAFALCALRSALCVLRSIVPTHQRLIALLPSSIPSPLAQRAIVYGNQAFEVGGIDLTLAQIHSALRESLA